MAKKRPPKTYVKTRKGKRKKLTPAQVTRRQRAERAAIRRIAKEEGITQKEARKIYKDAVIEVLFIRPKKYARRRFIEITPRHFQEIPQGRAIRLENAFGPMRDIKYIWKIQRLKQYWELVAIIADEYKLSIKDARKQIKDRMAKRKAAGQHPSVKAIIWEETGES